MTRAQRILDRPVRDLDDHVIRGGGHGLGTARRLLPAEVAELVAASGLRGRGGAGFPTGVKWQTIADFASPTSVTPTVINAAEGEPGTFKDRVLMRHDPYRVLEGALIAAHAVRSPLVAVAIKASFTIEIARMRRAIDEMRAAGWLGDVAVEVVPGPSEYLFGEETGLLEVIEGRPPFPRVTPPWRRGIDPGPPDTARTAADMDLATDEGSESAPALVNNVETLANVPQILSLGEEWYRSVGTQESPGTILCTVTGATARHGVGEFELGTPVGEVIEALGGGPRRRRSIRFVLSGVANPPLPASLFDTPLCYAALRDAGSGLGSAGFVVIDDSVSPRWVAAQVAHFLSIESCGQCEPCKRDGLGIARALVGDDGLDPEDLSAHVTDMLGTVARGARCALAHQTEEVVGGILALDEAALDEEPTPAAPADADLMAIVPMVDLIGDRALLDLGHRDKARDWTYPDGEPGGVVWPIERLRNQPVTIRPPAVTERPVQTPLTVESLDPMAVISAFDEELRRSISALEDADAEARPAARAVLRDELCRHIDMLERIVVPLLDRIRVDGTDIGRYPDEHARRANALLSATRVDDERVIEHAHTAVEEVQRRIVPLLREELDEHHRRTVAAALEREADLLGLDVPTPVGDGAR